MPQNIFNITAPASSIRLDSRGHGEIQFTVSSLKEHAIRGRARIVVPDPTQMEKWFKVVGGIEHDFAPSVAPSVTQSVTQQYTVQVDTPRDAKPGKYSFRLDVLSVDQPDEDYTQGPSIGFEIPIVNGPNGPPWIIPVLVLVLLVIGGTATYLLLHRSGANPEPSPSAQPSATVTTPPLAKVTIPPVGGLTSDAAQRAISDAGLPSPKVMPPLPSLDVPVGHVIRTIPDIGNQVDKSTEVQIFVAGDSATVPTNLIGMHAMEASNAVGGVGLVPQFVGDGTRSTWDQNSTVTDTDPVAGQVRLKGSKVNLFVPGPHLILHPGWFLHIPPGGLINR